MNPDRVSVLDVDVDIEGGRRKQTLDHLRRVYGDDRVANVATFGTEKAKSAILTACRGLGIDVDIAQYLSSMVAEDRGIQRTLSQTFYGDEDAGYHPNQQFVYEMTENYPEVWEVAQKIEGLVCRLGEHAGGVIFVDEPFTKSTALMRAPNDDLMTQYDLHDCEDCSLIKYDLLSIEALDKMHICLNLLEESRYIEPEENLRQTYEKVLGIYNLEREAPEMWKMVWNHDIQSLFQMEKQSGIQGIALTHPESVDDLATLNSVIRLMAQEKGAEQPLNKFARFKEDISQWYQEMTDYGLTKQEQKLLEPVVKLSYGICESQEGFMQLVQMPECGGFDLTWADRLRKSIAKKNPTAYEELQQEYFQKVEEAGLSKKLCNYVWNVLVATSRGYGFNKSHTLAYSLIALQEMNLAYKYPTMFWNCACLISNSGGAEDNTEEEEDYEVPTEEVYTDCIEEFSEDSEDEDDDDEIVTSDKKKKKTKTNNYGKIATAIGKIKSSGVNVAPPDINKSTYTFSPDIEGNTIRYGLSGITRIGDDLIKEIIAKRPYESLEDFLSRVKITKPQVVNLIKSGAFDKFGNRVAIMKQYINMISDTKKTINLRNLQMLINMNLLPHEFDFEIRVFNFNKYLKKFKNGNYYLIDTIAFRFWEENFSIDLLVPSEETESGFKVKQADWDKIYKSYQNILRPYIKAHEAELREAVNSNLSREVWNKYAVGNMSQWEMDSVSYYSHNHELENANLKSYFVEDFESLSEQPNVDRVITIKGKTVPLFQIHRIAGTVLDKDKTKKTISLLTTDGVVTVKIFGEVFNHYDRQISMKDPTTGKKKVMEKSWLSRGNKVIISGIRREDSFIAKKYARTPWHLVELITKVDSNGVVHTRQERLEVE